jgi:hypothetical protein
MEEKEGYVRIMCPPGDLGLSFDKAGVCSAVEAGSKTEMQVAVGWRLMGLQSPEATSTKKDPPAKIVQLISDQAHNERELLFQRPADPELVTDQHGRVTVHAPPGPLGLTLCRDEDPQASFSTVTVDTIKRGSPIAHSVRPGMALLAVDGDDVSKLSPTEVAELLVKRKDQSERVLTFAMPYESPWPLRIGIALVVGVVAFISWVFITIYLGHRAQERAALAQQRAEYVVGRLAANENLDLSHDFLIKVVAPAMLP